MREFRQPMDIMGIMVDLRRVITRARARMLRRVREGLVGTRLAW